MTPWMRYRPLVWAAVEQILVVRCLTDFEYLRTFVRTRRLVGVCSSAQQIL